VTGWIDRPASPALLTAFGAALVPVLFSYGGWQTATFVAGEIKEPKKNLARGLIFGVVGVVVLYLAANVVYIKVLGTKDLAISTAPASQVMRAALGDTGGRLMAIGIAISTLGFLSQSMLTAPRVYYAMAKDRLFFKAVGAVHPKTHAPIVAIALQGLMAIVLATWSNYNEILSYVVATDFIFFGLTACCIFIFRKRLGIEETITRVPGHPFTTLLFIAVCWLVVLNTIYTDPRNGLFGIVILLAGIPAYLFWRWRNNRQ
jgi:APA family basic amino acid/polyamine antiporter